MHDKDTLSIINEEKTAELKTDPRFVKFHAWLQENGARYPDVEIVIFGRNGELMGLAAKKDLPPQRAFLFIPDKLTITVEAATRDSVLGPIMTAHPELFAYHPNASYLSIITFLIQ